MKRTLSFFLMMISLVVLVACGSPQTAVPEPSAEEAAATQAPALRSVTPETNSQPIDKPIDTTAEGPVSDDSSEETAVVNAERQKKLAAELGDAVILYQRSGGIAGIVEGYFIYADGRVVDKTGKEWQIPAVSVQAIISASEALGFAQLKDSYIPANNCCDQFTYGLIIRSGDTIHQVLTADASTDVPDELNQLLQSVSDIVNNLNQ